MLNHQPSGTLEYLSFFYELLNYSLRNRLEACLHKQLSCIDMDFLLPANLLKVEKVRIILIKRHLNNLVPSLIFKLDFCFRVDVNCPWKDLLHFWKYIYYVRHSCPWLAEGISHLTMGAKMVERPATAYLSDINGLLGLAV